MKTKVMTIVGTRPEIIKLSRTINELDKFTDHILVHTGQNYDYELNEIFFDDLGIRKPNYFLNAVGESTAETISKIIFESDKIIESFTEPKIYNTPRDFELYKIDKDFIMFLKPYYEDVNDYDFYLSSIKMKLILNI